MASHTQMYLDTTTVKQCAAKASVTVCSFSPSCHQFCAFSNYWWENEFVILSMCSLARHLTLKCSSETVKWTVVVLGSSLVCYNCKAALEYKTVSADYSWINTYLSLRLKYADVTNVSQYRKPYLSKELLNCIIEETLSKNHSFSRLMPPLFCHWPATFQDRGSIMSSGKSGSLQSWHTEGGLTQLLFL